MSEEISYLQLKTKNEARISEDQREEQRKRNLMLLILQYLREEGYLDTASVFLTEAGPNLQKFEVCDNIDLHTILQEFETYYYMRFNRWPKIAKRACDHADAGFARQSHKHRKHSKDVTKPSSASLPSIVNKEQWNDSAKYGVPKRPASDTKQRKTKFPTNQDNLKSTNDKKVSPDMASIDLKGHSMATHSKNSSDNKINSSKIKNDANDSGFLTRDFGISDRLMKPISGLPNITSEWRDLAAVISRDIYLEHPNVTWDDIIGLDVAKQLVKEAVVYPIKYPQLFTGILSPWKGLLLYGPPGTGKTLLAKAVATQCKTTFFNISASTIVSKWRGDSEKLVRVLFELARFHAPSTIFLDELDSVMSQRGAGSGGSTEHEGSRRMKTELLVQMDGLSKSDDLVFLLAASNLPWELDHAMLRRLEKRILVDLPTLEARRKMFEHFLPPRVASKQGGLEFETQIDYEIVSDVTQGYSGSDICLVCKEAAMRPVRKIFNILETHESDDRNELPSSLKIDPVTTDDITETLKRTKPSSGKLKSKYESWQKEYESV